MPANTLISKLQAAAEAHPRGEKILIVPERAMGHHILENLVRAGTPWIHFRDETLTSLAREIAGGVLATVDSAMSHDLWKRMTASREKYFEVPISAMEDDTVVRGVIDMIFKEDGEWVIVDFKTDDFEKDPGRKAAYERQLDHYARLWAGITGEKVKAGHLMKV